MRDRAPALVDALLKEVAAGGFLGEILPTDADREIFTIDNSIYRVARRPKLFPRRIRDIAVVIMIWGTRVLRRCVSRRAARAREPTHNGTNPILNLM